MSSGPSSSFSSSGENSIVFLCITRDIISCQCLSFSSVNQTFADVYGFSQGQQGLVFVAFLVGASVGALFTQWSDKLYQRDAKKEPNGKAPPESRLYAACVGSLVVPAAVYMFAWTGKASIPWIVPIIALGLFQAGVFPIYLASFAYLGDSYEIYASSAMSAQSLLRNIMTGACF